MTCVRGREHGLRCDGKAAQIHKRHTCGRNDGQTILTWRDHESVPIVGGGYRELDAIQQATRSTIDHVDSVSERLEEETAVLVQLLPWDGRWEPSFPIDVR